MADVIRRKVLDAILLRRKILLIKMYLRRKILEEMKLSQIEKVECPPPPSPDKACCYSSLLNAGSQMNNERREKTEWTQHN